ISKDQFHAKLDTSRIPCRVNHAKCTAIVEAIRPRHEGGSRRAKQTKIHVVDDVEGLGAKLKMQILANGDVLHHRKININDTWIPHVRQDTPQTAKSIGWRIDESGGIEPLAHGRIVELCALASRIRPRSKLVVRSG